MKDLLIIVGTMVLGFFVFSMIAGDKDSLKSAGSAVMERNIELYQEECGV